MSYRIINGKAYSIQNISSLDTVQNQNNLLKNNSEKKFNDVLAEVVNKNEGFKVSKHAASRLDIINFNEDDMKMIEKGFKLAKEKNSKNTVMLYKDVALIASVENKTLITAVEKDRVQENIFTNIDSVVIL